MFDNNSNIKGKSGFCGRKTFFSSLSTVVRWKRFSLLLSQPKDEELNDTKRFGAY